MRSYIRINQAINQSVIKQSLHQIGIHTCSTNSINIPLYQTQTIIWLSSKYWNIYTIIGVQSIPKIYHLIFDHQAIITSNTCSYVFNQFKKYMSVSNTNHYLIIKQILKYIHGHTCTINPKNIRLYQVQTIIWLSNNYWKIYAFIRVQSIPKIYIHYLIIK